MRACVRVCACACVCVMWADWRRTALWAEHKHNAKRIKRLALFLLPRKALKDKRATTFLSRSLCYSALAETLLALERLWTHVCLFCWSSLFNVSQIICHCVARHLQSNNRLIGVWVYDCVVCVYAWGKDISAPCSVPTTNRTTALQHWLLLMGKIHMKDDENVVLFIWWEHLSYWFVLSQMRCYYRDFSKSLQHWRCDRFSLWWIILCF